MLESAGDTSSGGESGGGEDLTGPESEASADETAEVKAVIEQVLATKDAGDDSAGMGFFNDEAVTAIQEIIQGAKDVQAKAMGLNSLMEEKFGQEYPQNVRDKYKKMQTEAMGPLSAAEMLADVSMEQLGFTKIGDKVVATGPGDNKLVFSKTAEGWKIGYDKAGREQMKVVSELLKAVITTIDAVKAGLDDDSINVDNVEAKDTGLDEQHIEPVRQKMKAMGEGGAAPADGDAAPADGDAAPADGDAAPADGGAAPADGGAAPADGGAAPADAAEAAPTDAAEAAPADGDGL
jgi:hypothetical protein